MSKNCQVALITGSARRVGASIASCFHAHGYNVVVHYRHSGDEARALTACLNQQREHSAVCLSADLDVSADYEKLIIDSHDVWQRLDVLVNNASTFSPTPVGHTKQAAWDLLLNSNLKAPYFLSEYAAPYLREHYGNIVNITDIHATKPMKNYSIYSCAKAGLAMLTKSLALELAPTVRVNAVAPGSVIWPEGENEMSDTDKKEILSATWLKKQVSPEDIASAVLFLALHQTITGQTITVDGGR